LPGRTLISRWKDSGRPAIDRPPRFAVEWRWPDGFREIFVTLRRAFLALCLAAIPAAAMAASAGADSDPWMAAALDYSRARIGLPMSNGWRAIEARVEGRTLVVVVSPPAAGAEGLPPEDLAVSTAIGLCQSPSRGGFFADGRMLRVDLNEGGRILGSSTLNACPDRTAATGILARSIQRRAGMSLGRTRLAGARAEGTELVLLIDGATGWRRGLSPEQVNALYFPAYCRNPDTRFYFDGTRTVRIDTLENGRSVRRGQPISSCEPFAG
jgi:hypothetical protein